jgi:hypothetical protein
MENVKNNRQEQTDGLSDQQAHCALTSNVRQTERETNKKDVSSRKGTAVAKRPQVDETRAFSPS